MRPIALFILLSATAFPQTKGKLEFEVASIKANPPQTGFHFGNDAVVSGGPGTTDPGIFRCSKCTLSALILKAFRLQAYQLPGKSALPETTYEVMARVPAQTTEEDFSTMLQNLLRERFGLVAHFQQKTMKGYHLVVAKGGAKLQASGSAPATAGQPGGESHAHSGLVAFGSSASYRAAKQSMAELAQVLSEQVAVPVDDQTGLTGRYDILLRWSGNAGAGHAGNHSDGGFAGAGGHDGHGGAGGGGFGLAADPSGPGLFDALQQQLGLKLVAAEQSTAQLFIVDKVLPRPTEN